MEKRASLLVLFFSLLTFAGCASSREAAPRAEDYVEIDNPAFTMSPNAPPTVWVPRSDVEGAIPRGGELIVKGYQALRGNLTADAVQQPSDQAVAAAPIPAPAKPLAARRAGNRIFTLEVGRNGLLAPFNKALARGTGDQIIDASRAAMVARYAAVATPAERSALTLKLQEDFGANLVLFISATEGMRPGGAVTVEMFEGYGGALVKRLRAEVPSYAASDSGARDAALSPTLAKLTSEVRSVAALLPWYCKVVSVDGDRVYVNAGRESGLAMGSVMTVYRGGKVVEKLGFAPGPKIGVLEIEGFVGTDGAFGTVRDGGKVQASDLAGFQ